ncbi:MAG: alkaline phosphatase family protein [Tannerellaceae bacterium]|jgi:hypothetical protein|nr:alkaline phosphatase family protein [Tannerellaceae bacterium]
MAWLLVALHVGAKAEAPHLVVFIAVDQLRGDYLEYFSATLSQGGFKRLLGAGTVFAGVDFDFPNLDCATAMATLCTGTNPALHGIDGSRAFDFDTEREYSILYDADFLGNYTDNHFSPKALISSTFGDELKIASKGRSQVFAIAATPEAAILSAGHAGDAAFWIDDANGKWATTTFYRDLPWYVDRYNNGPEALSARLGAMVWVPRLPLEEYCAFPYLLDDLPFRHTFPPDNPESIPDFKTSPFVNDEITQLAIRFLEFGVLGARPVPDLLAITFHAGLFRPQRDKEYTREVQDLYLRLDANLDTFLQVIDTKVGLSHTLIVLTGTGYFDTEEDYPETILRHYGVFYPKRCLALLNMYLMAVYGQERKWVRGYHNGQIHLERKAIDDAGLALSTVRHTAADFVREFTGVQEVLTPDAMDGDVGTHSSRRGDLILRLQPGRRLDFERTTPSGRTFPPLPVIRHNIVPAPVVFFGNGIAAERHAEAVKATQIAPTITHLLRIHPPNACSERPLQLH